MMYLRRALPSAGLMMTSLAIFTLSCGTKPGLGDGGDKTGTGVAAGAAESGGSNGSGGLGQGGATSGGGGTANGGTVAKGGASGTGGLSGTGGSIGSGGAIADAGVACADDAGSTLPAAARRCTQDSDCTIAVAPRCCGVDLATGEAKSQSATYAFCLAQPPGACQGLGCAKFLGYSTDTGNTTPVGASSGNPLELVSVRCLDQICTTDVATAQDGGRDAVAADAPGSSDGGSTACGSVACSSNQLCIRPSCAGGTAPICLSASDGGVCLAGYTFSSFCQYVTGGGPGPGCMPPACVNPPPFCLDTPAACNAKLTCGCLPSTVCGANGGGCMMITASTVQCGAA